MNSTTQIISHFFLLSLAFGTLLFSPVVNTRLTGVGFFRLGTSIVLASLIMALGVDFYMKPTLGTFQVYCYVFLIVSNIFTYILHKDQKNWLMWTIYVLQVITFSSLAFSLFEFHQNWTMLFFSSSLLLGISNFSMLLGHYYLVVPKLSEEPLIYCLHIFWTIMFFKIISSLTVIFSSGMSYLHEGTNLGDGYIYNWLFISMRYIWGYLAPLVLSFFTFRLCKIRSIQSATGVLYIVEFFVIVGELISVYLMAKHGLAL